LAPNFNLPNPCVKVVVPQLGSVFLCADLELTVEPSEDHASHIESWLKVLKIDRRANFSAAA